MIQKIRIAIRNYLISGKGTDFDTRWISLPIMSFLTYVIGDVSLWVIGLVLIASFKINVKL